MSWQETTLAAWSAVEWADYDTAEARLTAFKAIGEAVLARYFDTK